MCDMDSPGLNTYSDYHFGGGAVYCNSCREWVNLKEDNICPECGCTYDKCKDYSVDLGYMRGE